MPSSRTKRRAGSVVFSSLLLVAAGCKQKNASTGSAGAELTTPQARKAAHQPYTTPPAVKKHLYPAPEEAAADIASAEKQAAAEHKRVLLDFGGDWCGDCQVLDIYFHQEPNASLLNNNFVKVNVNIGHEDANLDLAHKYGVPVKEVPALAVLTPQGKVLYAQTTEFGDMRYMEPNSVTQFLNQWKQ